MPNVSLPPEHVENGSIPPPLPRLGLPAGARPKRPRGPLRHYAGFLSPSAAAAMPLLLERNRPQRLRRLAATAGDGVAQRRRPTRPRMRVLTAAPGARLRWREAPAPCAPGPDGAVVHPIAAATCDIDCPLVLGATQLALPLHLGHECVAEVLSVGERVATVRAGRPRGRPLPDQLRRLRPLPLGAPRQLPGGAAALRLRHGPRHRALRRRLLRSARRSLRRGDARSPAGWHRPRGRRERLRQHLRRLPPCRAPPPRTAGRRPRRRGADPRLPLPAVAVQLQLPALHRPDRACARRPQRHPRGLSPPRPRARRAARPERAAPPRAAPAPPAPLVAHISADPLATALAHTAPDGICTSSGGLHRSARLPLLQIYVRRATLHVGIPTRAR